MGRETTEASNTEEPGVRDPVDEPEFSFVIEGGQVHAPEGAATTVNAQDEVEESEAEAGDGCEEGHLEIVDVVGLGLYGEVGPRESSTSVGRMSTASLSLPATSKGQGLHRRNSLFYEHLNDSEKDWTSVEKGMETPRGAVA